MNMAYYEFKIRDDNGTITTLFAQNREHAIEGYCAAKGCPKEYVKEHCIDKISFSRPPQNMKGE